MVDTLAQGTSEASADMLVAARSVVGSPRRGTSVTSPAGISASSAITTTVTDSAALVALGLPFGVASYSEYPPYPYGADPYCDPSSPWYNPAYCHWRHRDE